MDTKTRTPSMSVIALATGKREALFEAAAQALTHAAVQAIGHGNTRTLDDTLSMLQEVVSGARGKLVLSMVEEVSAACKVARPQGEGLPRGADRKITKDGNAALLALAEGVVSRAAENYHAEDESAADARKVKATTAKAAKAKAEKETARALASVAKPALPAMTVTQAIERLRAALTAGDDQAFAALFKMTDEFTSLAVEGQPADVVIA